MKPRRIALLAALLGATLAWQPAAADQARRGADSFRFGVIGHAFKTGPDDAAFKQAIRETDRASMAFVVVTGIKAGFEPCSDKLYSQRKDLFDESARPLILSLAASDWSDCKTSRGRPAAIDRLNLLRDMFFADGMSLGARKIALSRLSSSAKFRSYAENAYWEYGSILFATINLPADNNRFRPEAGRNGEFEDRMVANRAWLQRLFAMAQRRKLAGIVLFSDGNTGAQEKEEERSLLSGFGARQDGFAGMRRQIRTLAKKFAGKVLLVDAQSGPVAPRILWRDNLGHISVSSNWVEIRATPGAAPLFDIKGNSRGTPAQ